MIRAEVKNYLEGVAASGVRVHICVSCRFSRVYYPDGKSERVDNMNLAEATKVVELVVEASKRIVRRKSAFTL